MEGASEFVDTFPCFRNEIILYLALFSSLLVVDQDYLNKYKVIFIKTLAFGRYPKANSVVLCHSLM